MLIDSVVKYDEVIADCTKCANISGVQCGCSPSVYVGTNPIKAMVIGHSPTTKSKNKATVVLNMDKKRAFYFITSLPVYLNLLDCQCRKSIAPIY